LENFIKQYGGTAFGEEAKARLAELKKRQVAVVEPPAAAKQDAIPARPIQPAAPNHVDQFRQTTAGITSVLQRAAKSCGEANKLPSGKDYLTKPLYTETREDREKKIRDELRAELAAKASEVRTLAENIAARNPQPGNGTLAMRDFANTLSISIPQGAAGTPCYDAKLAERLRQTAKQVDEQLSR
jgi:hypothetical protein